jgi:CheY-like chemotaxis protein
MSPGLDDPAGDVGRPPPSSGPEAARIVLVDEDVALLREASAALRGRFGAGRVREATDAYEAIRWVERERPAVLVADVRGPMAPGLELIARARELWGAVPTVAMTAFPPPAVRSGASSGTFAFLPKPFALGALYEVVGELEARPPPSLGGPDAGATLADLLQLYAAAGADGALAVRAGGLRGEVWFEGGRIVHARTAAKAGVDAFCDVVRWPHGSFAFRPRRAEVRTIELSTPELLLGAYRGWSESLRPSEDVWGDEAQAGDLRGAATVQSESRERVRENDTMNNINETLARLQSIDGFIGACLVDSDSGMTLGIIGGGAALNLEVAGAGNTEVVRSKRKAMKALNLKDEIEDILITLGRQYHLMRPLRARPGVFFYLALDRTRANLAMARFTLADAEKDLSL